MRKTIHSNMAAVALLWTQELLLIQARRMPKDQITQWLHAANTPIKFLHYANPSVIQIATRISKTRIERFVRQTQGRRLPA